MLRNLSHCVAVFLLIADMHRNALVLRAMFREVQVVLSALFSSNVQFASPTNFLLLLHDAY